VVVAARKSSVEARGSEEFDMEDKYMKLRLAGALRASMVTPLALMLFALNLHGCSDDDEGNPRGGASGKGGGSGADGGAGKGGTGASAGVGGTGGGAGSAGQDGGAGSGNIGIEKAAEANSPFDATPSPDGKTVYFTAVDPAESSAGVFKVAATGGAITPLHVGSPLSGPVGITTSSDGQKLLIADVAAEWTDGGGNSFDTGQIFSLSVAGGAPSAVPGTSGMQPRGLELRNANGADEVVFSGVDAQSGAPNVFKIASAGGTAMALAPADALSDPSGIAIAQNGDVYVADSTGANTRLASVLLVKGGTATAIASDLPVGYPVGIALTMDDSALFVSGLDPATLTDVVYRIDIATKAQSRFTGSGSIDISKFEESAGLHRAKNANVFAWADSRANTAGTVYLVTIQ
jgi:sugar lactone lactonase YvrE